MKPNGDAHRLLNHLCAVYLGHRERTSRAVAREMLLASPVFRCGYLCDVRAKGVGAGVCDVWLEDRSKAVKA